MSITELFKDKAGVFDPQYGSEIDITNLTPQELRDYALKLAKMETEDEMHAALAGVLSGRIMENYFGRLDERHRTNRQENAKGRSEVYYLALLQAQLDAYRAEAGRYRGMIDDFETRHFSAEQRVRLNALPEENRFSAKDQEMRQLLKEGKVTEQEYDDWRDWHAKEADALRNATEVKNIMTNGPLEQIEEAATKRNIDNVRSQRDVLSDRDKQVVEEVVEDRYDAGDDTRQNDFDSLLGGLGVSSATSFANDAAPETSLRENAPALQIEFETKAGEETDVKPDAKVDLTVKPNPEDAPPSQGV